MVVKEEQALLDKEIKAVMEELGNGQLEHLAQVVVEEHLKQVEMELVFLKAIHH
jgi:hypothetical protein